MYVFRYRGAVRSGAGIRIGRWTLLCTLALAVLGMHHLASQQMACHKPIPVSAPTTHSHTPASGMSDLTAVVSAVVADAPSAQSSDGPASGASHDMMHLCLAILSATVWLLLLVLLSSAVGTENLVAARLRRFAGRAWRPLRPAGRSLLTSVCVLRI